MVQILVIDDDRHMRTACSRVLSATGWSVTSAETGDEGLQVLRNGPNKFDVVLLDQLLPGITGTEVLSRIRAIDPRLPVIIMTGSATYESVSEIKRLGAFDCLPKPFTPKQLRNAILNAVSH
jgi:DNA-binding NtrC family response regulator